MLNSVVVHYAWLFHSCQMDVPVKMLTVVHIRIPDWSSERHLRRPRFVLQPGCFYSCATSTINMEQFYIYGNQSMWYFCFVQLLCNYCATCDRATVNALDESSVFTQLATSMSSHFSTDICHSGGVSRSCCSICEYVFHHYEAIWLYMGMLTHDTHQCMDIMVILDSWILPSWIDSLD